MRIGGALLVTVGILLLTGIWSHLIASLQGQVNGFEPAV
jgi:cytochrome c-type biogenesis protein